MRKLWSHRHRAALPAKITAAVDESLATAEKDVEYQKWKQRLERDVIDRLKAARDRNQLADTLARALSQHGRT